MDKIISKYLLKLFIGCYIIAMLFILFSNGNNSFAFQMELLLIGVCGICFMLKIEIPFFTYILFAVAFFIRFIVVLGINTMPESDFWVLFSAAERMIEGDFSFSSESYFQTWAYQTGYVIYAAMILKIWNSLWALKIMNCVWGAGITVLVYKIAREIWKAEKPAQFVAILYSIFVFPVFHVTVLANSHPSAFFLYLGVYVLLKEKNDIKSFFLSALCLAVGNILRPDGIILLVSIGAFFFFSVIEIITLKNIYKQMKKICIFFATYFLIVNIASASIVATGINLSGLSNQNPLWKFVLGFNYETKGGYSEEDIQLIEERKNEYQGDLEKAEMSIIKERINSVPQMFDLFMNKINTMWWNSSGISWSFTGPQYDKIQDILKKINFSEFYWIFLLSIIGIPEWVRIAKANKKVLLIPFIIFSAFCVYLLIEVQARYAYLQQIAVFILGAGGVKVLLKFGEKMKIPELFKIEVNDQCTKK